MKKNRIGFIGYGNMAGAIINSLLNSKKYTPSEIYIFEKNDTKVDAADKAGLTVCYFLRDLFLSCDIINLSVKPTDFESVLEGIRGFISSENIIISFAPGIKIKYIKNKLKNICPVIRVMPNMPSAIGKGATAICKCDSIIDEDFKYILSLFKLTGIVEEIDENKFEDIIAVNASSPVYVYMLAQAMCEYAVAKGISYRASEVLVFNAIRGSAEMLLRSEYTPYELIQMVSSPGGTTLEAIDELNRRGYMDSIKKAMEACTKRAKRMSIE